MNTVHPPGGKLKKKIIGALVLAGLISGYATFEIFSGSGAPRKPASVPENYQTLTGCQKQDVLWEKIQATAHEDLPPYSKFGVVQLVKMGLQKISVKGSLHSDFSPPGWQKYLHRRGAVAKVRIVPTDSSYTGIFQGADCALLRLSLTYRAQGSRPVAPGLALKVLRDATDSGNISALVSLEGQEKDFNFFKHPMSNIVPTSHKFGQKLVHKIFLKVTPYPEELGVSDLASTDAQGVRVKKSKSPRQLFFVPAGLSFSSEEHDVREDFMTIPEGTIVYRLHALPKKFHDFDYSTYTHEQIANFIDDSEHIADIVTTSRFIASEFGDQGLFFRHEIRSKYK